MELADLLRGNKSPASVTYTLTPRLRWVWRWSDTGLPVDYVNDEREQVLQQGWQNMRTGEIEWRDVPTEE